MAGSMDFATRTLDLTRALSELATRDNAVVDGATALVGWLGREGIPKREFEYCMNLAQGKAYPNEFGLDLRRQLLQKEQSDRKIGPLKLTTGSLSSLIAMDPEYGYLATTVTALMAYHDIAFIARAICDFVLDAGGHEGGLSSYYDMRKTRIKPVITKLVSSIALNIVNPGHGLEHFSTQFDDICAHVLQPDVFAATIAAIQNRNSDVLISCDIFYADLTLWIMHHWVGTLEVVNVGNVIFTRHPSEQKSKRGIKILIRKKCIPIGNNHPNPSEAEIKISVAMGSGGFQTVLKASGLTEEVRGTIKPTSRFSLYDMDRLGQTIAPGTIHRTSLNPTEETHVYATAKAVAEWLLKQHLSPLRVFDSRTGLKHSGFEVKSEDTGLTLANLLKRWPTISKGSGGSRLVYGSLHEGTIVFRGPPPNRPPTAPRTSTPAVSQHDFDTIWEVVQCFPPITTLCEMAQQRCSCPDCIEPSRSGKGKPGCLRETALTTFLLLTGHFVAEVFGAPDVSGMSDPETLKLIAAKMLYEVAIDRRIWWDTWFAIAGSVYTGCSWTTIDFSGNEGASNVVAVQYGSMVAAAQWLDITANHEISGCFGMEIAEGQLVDLSDELLVLSSERNLRPPRPGVELDSNDEWLELDGCLAQVDTCIIGAGSNTYRLLTLIKSGSFMRIVDPAATMWNKSCSLTPRCNHDPDSVADTDNFEDLEISGAWAFDAILGSWEGPEDWDNSIPWTSKILDSDLKLNVAISLAPEAIVLRRKQCCMHCAAKAASSTEWNRAVGTYGVILNHKIEPGVVARR